MECAQGRDVRPHQQKSHVLATRGIQVDFGVRAKHHRKDGGV